MATAYTGNIVIQNSKGQGKTIQFTASDVAGEFWLYPSGGSELPLSSLPSVIRDLTASSASGTTKNIEIFINGMTTGQTIPLANIVATAVLRPFQQVPLGIPAGATFKIVQRA